jgi:3-phenylpropionate/trans-cinnamate dioxygenase ferredoxin subunit
MTKHVVARAEELPPGTRKRCMIDGRAVLVLNIKGELFALSDTCPHRGASLSGGILTGLVVADAPGEYHYARQGEILRCPWHAWEFDVRTGRSHCDPKRWRLMQHAVSRETGAAVAEQGYVAETFPVRVEEQYVVVEV